MAAKTVRSIVQEIPVDSFNHYLETINTFDTFSAQKKSVILFRGQEDALWDLSPGLPRRAAGIADIPKLEKEVLSEFKRRAIPFLPSTFNVNSAWEWLALSQHFKLPTRLLDWTENPLVALFFAFEFAKSSLTDRAVWVFITNEGEFADTNDPALDPFNQKETKVYLPNQVTQRITVQSGWFTVHKYLKAKNKFVPLNKNAKYISRIHKLIMPESLREDVLLRLDRLGINSFSIYPDLEGLSHFLTWKYFN